ncbi:single-stranded-DNA-specific exonuclease RecJ [Candidatus Kaiserbacteria bacterium RIFCSPHIGHO2_02_FULL_55_25]|uniref:Single-stranded-DNA-specific exonuclease RecJ n=1 Tax=Candidatus Kaiserbacteria bacterium RIFCSPHIGHO2_02_FULL_55_25 TaxID=1798498 RepID=A0A1F6E6L8_9BACT|nr:MAG: single-stranded-DNA-specific exonuclease RecJ [Candidatus Kaiserbacteria bacterium RIFCSPHIGHO2_01_FULL_55_79]OGG69271.1 MAG: single-stranded-DNA-specific exonuclease RecJ [Candidatus Kaiserbacteria bacterium RIFCSPHIGHO2_02_FULL_55_25]OGG77036.1 MAG: single-stranded-DNA-specific exonuclease RecJ [Candidatus Kaiserbacteria bacterium RIFCSPHIGHO2_12_FULL_55_13]OGG83905.1 MAG: single-stranded-DNA-specific exonuclease RecJ [Candidatus Kaiserbacteria bacterium RIFCSPLOWO2_01_FULL_55_25]
MEISELVRGLLSRRGVTSDEDITAFLAPDYEKHTHAPQLLLGMERATARILAAMRGNERIAVYADFDCDGIPGAAVLSDFFNKVGYQNFEVYLPHRDREGYGFHTEAISQLASRGVTLIITVDVGTTAVEPVAFAKEKGIDVIVTDHHEITGALPECIAVLNPKLGTYPFPSLCGAAMAFKLVQALLRSPSGELRQGAATTVREKYGIPEGWEKWLLDLVAIATVADMVPLTGENRVLAYWGLQVLRKSPRQGLVALCNRLRLRRAELTEDDIGFSIAPRINAASRMDEPDLALRLLTTQDAAEAEQLAAHLEELNASRKGVVGSIVREAKKHARERFGAHERVVVLGNPEWKPALLGLAANSLMEERGGMVCLWGRDALGRIKGSCRSDGALSVVDVFASAGESFVEYGGHARSGGFSVLAEHVHTLHETLARASAAMGRAEIAVSGAHDALITLREVSSPLHKDISRLAPFGAGNPKPVFRIARAAVAQVKRFGKEKNHVEVTFTCDDTGASARAFDFFRAPEDFTQAPVPGASASVLATVERDSYRGGFALRLVDILPI